ncbi:MAG: hypothetical protein [Bacteriophage sp.]|nr:MAG: hypothetical protein [Bacteriophage sp.]
MTAFTRKSDTLISNTTGYGRNRYTPMLDLKYGGMNGHMPDWPAYISNTPYVRRNLIIRVMATPRGFNLLPESEKWHEALKALLEVHPLNVTGFNNQLEVETRETPYGGAGEMQESVSNVTRSRVEPVFNFVEKYGRPISIFFERWVLELIMDPNTKFPNVVTRAAARSQVVDLLPDFTSATILAFEPDPTFTKIDKAWLVADLKPKGSLAPVEGQRDIHQGGDLVEFPINFTGIAQIGAGVDALAQAVLDTMTLTGANPLQQPAFTTALSGDVDELSDGYIEKLSEAAARAVGT